MLSGEEPQTTSPKSAAADPAVSPWPQEQATFCLFSSNTTGGCTVHLSRITLLLWQKRSTVNMRQGGRKWKEKLAGKLEIKCRAKKQPLSETRWPVLGHVTLSERGKAFYNIAMILDVNYYAVRTRDRLQIRYPSEWLKKRKSKQKAFSPSFLSKINCHESSLEIMIRATSQAEPIGTNIAKFVRIQNRIDNRRL